MKKKEEKFNPQDNDVKIIERIDKLEDRIKSLDKYIINLSKFIDENKVIVEHFFDRVDYFYLFHSYSITYIYNKKAQRILIGETKCTNDSKHYSDINYTIFKNISNTLLIEVESDYYLINKIDNTAIKINDISDLLKE